MHRSCSAAKTYNCFRTATSTSLRLDLGRARNLRVFANLRTHKLAELRRCVGDRIIAGGNDGIGSDGDPWHDDGLMADEDVVKDVDLPHGVDSDIERLLNHVDTAVMAKDGATGQMDIAAQSGICRIGEFHIRLDAASLAHGVQTTMNLDVFCPCIAVGLANPLIQTYQLAGFKGVCTKRFFNCCVNWTRHLKFIYRVDD